MTTATETFAYIYDADNRLKEIRQTNDSGPLMNAFDYDDNGNLTAKKNGAGVVLQSYAYDQVNRVQQITAGAQTNTFEYDPLNYRIEKADSQGTKKYYLEGENLEAVYNGAGNLVDSYLRGVVVDEVVYGYHYDTDGDWAGYTFHHDHLRSVVALSEHDGTTVERTKYGPFGEELLARRQSKRLN